MSKKDIHSLINSTSLRQKAEELIKMRPSKINTPLSEAETLKCLHEIDVLQAELEVQNEELMQALSNLESLQESEKTFKAYLENSIDVIFTVNVDCEFVFVSNAWEQYFGIPGSEVIGKKFTQFMHPDDMAVSTEYVLRTLRTGQGGRSLPYRVKVFNGELRWCITNGKPYVDLRDNLLFLGMGHDITDRVNAEEALRESEKRFSLSMDVTSDGLWDWDIQTGIMYYSPGYFRMLGYEPNEFEKKIETWKNLIHPDDLDSAISNMEDCLKNITQNINVEYRMRAIDGSWRWILARGKAVARDGHGTALRMIGTHVDITQRKEVEQALMESEALYRAIINASPYQITISDLEGRITMFSPATLKLFGYEDSNEIIGRLVTDFLVPEDRERALADTSLRLQGTKTGPNVYLAQHANGSTFYFEVSGEFIQNVGKSPSQMLFIGRDVSDRKKAELEIKLKNDELSKLNAEKDRFFSIISHDLRGPFSGFLGYTHIMTEQLSNLSMEEIQKIATGMNKSATNLFNLLENLLQWARKQQGLIPFLPEVIQLRRIVNKNIELMMPLAISKDIVIANYIQEEILVFADLNMLQVVISNLISNALKFTPRGGRISLNARIREDKTVEISVSDAGIGISEQMIQKLFRIDEKPNRRGTEGEHSCGLGLILCKEFVEKHGEKIWVESEVGDKLAGKEGGSTFYFTLPLVEIKMATR